MIHEKFQSSEFFRLNKAFLRVSLQFSSRGDDLEDRLTRKLVIRIQKKIQILGNAMRKCSKTAVWKKKTIGHFMMTRDKEIDIIYGCQQQETKTTTILKFVFHMCKSGLKRNMNNTTVPTSRDSVKPSYYRLLI